MLMLVSTRLLGLCNMVHSHWLSHTPPPRHIQTCSHGDPPQLPDHICSILFICSQSIAKRALGFGLKGLLVKNCTFIKNYPCVTWYNFHLNSKSDSDPIPMHFHSKCRIVQCVHFHPQFCTSQLVLIIGLGRRSPSVWIHHQGDIKINTNLVSSSTLAIKSSFTTLSAFLKNGVASGLVFKTEEYKWRTRYEFCVLMLDYRSSAWQS